MDGKTIIAERFKTYRKKLGLSQTKLAEEINSAQTAISAYESGDRMPGTETLLTIANKHNVSPDWLLGLSDRMYLNGEVKTYTDILRLLVAVLSAKDSKSMDSVFTLSFHNDDTVYNDGVMLTVKDIHIRDFLIQWDSIYKLYKTHVIDKEIYTLWLEKHYAEMNEPIDLNNPFW